MDIFILDKNMETTYILNEFSSLIWTLRFNECGDFELCVPLKTELFDLLKIDYYLFSSEFYKNDRANLMIIESIEVDNSTDNATIKYTGRDLKSIIDRRIVWGTKIFDPGTHINTIVHSLMNDNVIHPTDWTLHYANSYVNAKTTGKILDLDAKFNPIGLESIEVEVPASSRTIDFFTYEEHVTENPPVEQDDLQYNSASLYETITNLCARYNMGWDVVYDFSTKQFVFILKSMVDKTQGSDNQAVVFSVAYNNITDLSYIESKSNVKNSGLIVGQDPAGNEIYQTYGNNVAGMERREMFISASTTSTDDTGRVDGNETYIKKLSTEFENELENHKYIKAVDAKVSNTIDYKYMEDYDLGDICDLANNFGVEAKVVVTEVILSVSDGAEPHAIPSFEVLDD